MRTYLALTSMLVLVLSGFLAAGGDAAAVPAFPCPYCVVDGIDGGGAVETEEGEAHVAIFATRVSSPDAEGDGLVIGRVQWVVTEAELTLDSVRVDDYGWIEDTKGGRWARGLFTVNGEGEVPFLLRAVDNGPPGSGEDTVELAVGNAVEGEAGSDFGYHAEGRLVAGDLQLLHFEPAAASSEAEEAGDPVR